jgi:hypothetical protein
MAHPSKLEELTQQCSRALASYMEEAQMTCALLDGIRQYPVSEEQRRHLKLQRSRENLAFVEYHEIRERLFRLVEWNQPKEQATTHNACPPQFPFCFSLFKFQTGIARLLSFVRHRLRFPQ